jgi:hypothetical protein
MRPWLYNGQKGRQIMENCNLPLQGVQKAASNVYLPVIRNSIFIPKVDEYPPSISTFMNNPVHVNTVKSIIDNAPLALTVIRSLSGMDDAAARTVYSILITNQAQPELNYNDLKEVEYAAFKRQTGIGSDDFECSPQQIEKYENWFRTYFSSVSLIEKLRDTRAYVGFTRVKPFDELDKNVRSLISQVSPSGELPVDIVRGEGIFIEFNKKIVEQWKAFEALKKRLEKLPAIKLAELKRLYKDPGVFMLLHTFSHILINELCLISGYNNSSLKERIYATSVNGNPMHGLLIYTNAGDSEGSLGGLVRNGKAGSLEPLVVSALQKADWCSSDPVCSEIIPQGHEGSNLSACHNCCLLPETACENMNLFLDRGMLRGSLADNSFGYFNKINI